MLMKKAQEQQIRDEEDKIKEKQAKAKIMLMEVEKANYAQNIYFESGFEILKYPIAIDAVQDKRSRKRIKIKDQEKGSRKRK